MNKVPEFLSSMKLAVILFIVIAAASLAGTLMEQEQANKIIYGSFWFIALLAVLLLNTTSCLLKKKFNAANAGSYLMHLGIPVIMAGAIAGAVFGYSGFVMIGEGETAGSIKANSREIGLPFSIKLKDFILERNAVNVRHVIAVHGENGKWKKYVFKGSGDVVVAAGIESSIRILEVFPDFVMGEDRKPATRSNEWNNPAVKIAAAGEEAWLFSEYPDFHGSRTFGGMYLMYECEVRGGEIKQYNSDIAVLLDEASEKGESARISVNKPYKYMGHTIYQASYDEKTLKSSGLIIKKDPGVPVVYAGFILLCLGMLIQSFRKLYSAGNTA